MTVTSTTSSSIGVSDLPTITTTTTNNNNKKRTYTTGSSIITPTKDEEDKIDNSTATLTTTVVPSTTKSSSSTMTLSSQYQQHLIPIQQLLQNNNVNNVSTKLSSGNSNNDDGTTTTTKTNIPEWVMIEINGELIKPSQQTSNNNNDDNNDKENSITTISSYELGSIQIRNNKEATMIIGTHEIQGTIELLKQPFCVLQKHYSASENNDNLNIHQDDTNESQPHQSLLSSYHITGIVTTKILFTKYPKTIIRRR